MPLATANPTPTMPATLVIGTPRAEADFATCRGAVFGHLLALATPVLDYPTDLYYDALWLQRHLAGSGLVFFYRVARYGTTVALTLDEIADQHPPTSLDAATYRVVAGLDPEGRYTIATDRVA